jgi:hypothetical protein
MLANGMRLNGSKRLDRMVHSVHPIRRSAMSKNKSSSQSPESPLPPANDLKVTLSVQKPYRSQKVMMQVAPTNPPFVAADGKYVLFEDMDSSQGTVPGIQTYPGDEGQLVQDISANEQGPWTCQGIVISGGDFIQFAAETNNSGDPNDPKPIHSKATGQVYGTGLPIDVIATQLPPTAILKSSSGDTKPTPGGTNQVQLEYAITDASGNAPDASAVFSGFFTPNGGDFANFDFWQGNDIASATKVTAFGTDPSNPTMAIDSTPASNQKMLFWVVPKSGVKSGVIDLGMLLGDQDLEVGEFVIIDPTQAPSQALPSLKLDGESGGTFQLDSTVSSLRVYVNKPQFSGALKLGDRVIGLRINGQDPSAWIPKRFNPNSAYNNTAFLVPTVDPRLKIGPGDSNTAIENKFQYIAYRPGDASWGTKAGPVYSVWLYGQTSGNHPHNPPTPNYAAPICPQYTPGTLLTADDIIDQFVFEVHWSDKGSNWQPAAKQGDKITLYFWMNGWDANGKTFYPFSTIPLAWFYNYGPETGDAGAPNSMLEVQYSVLPAGMAPGNERYSDKFSCYFVTNELGT